VPVNQLQHSSLLELLNRLMSMYYSNSSCISAVLVGAVPPAEAAQQPGDASQLPSLPSHISTFGDDGNDEQEQDEGSGEADAAAGRSSLEQRRQRSVRFDEGAGAAVLDAITAASQLPSHISAFGDDLGSNVQGGCAALAGSDELEAEAPASEWAAAGGQPLACCLQERLIRMHAVVS
jgi:hypothetical protein